MFAMEAELLEQPWFTLQRRTLPLSTRLGKIWLIKSMSTAGSEFDRVPGHSEFGSVPFLQEHSLYFSKTILNLSLKMPVPYDHIAVYNV